MSYASLVFGTPSGFESCFARDYSLRVGESQTLSPEDINAFAHWIAPFSDDYVYHQFSDLLSYLYPSERLWMVQRLDEADSEHELVLTAHLRQCYSTNRVRTGFYGAGIWHDRHEITVPGAVMINKLPIWADILFDQCAWRNVMEKDKGVEPFMFSRSFGLGHKPLEQQLKENAYVGVRIEQTKSSAAPKQYQGGLRAFVWLDGEDGEEGGEITADFLNQIHKARSLLQCQVLYASTSERMRDLILNWHLPKNRGKVPLHLDQGRAPLLRFAKSKRGKAAITPLNEVGEALLVSTQPGYKPEPPGEAPVVAANTNTAAEVATIPATNIKGKVLQTPRTVTTAAVPGLSGEEFKFFSHLPADTNLPEKISPTPQVRAQEVSDIDAGKQEPADNGSTSLVETIVDAADLGGSTPESGRQPESGASTVVGNGKSTLSITFSGMLGFFNSLRKAQINVHVWLVLLSLVLLLVLVYKSFNPN